LSVKVAVIGCGTWGKNLVRNFFNLEVLYSICDMDSELVCKISSEYKSVQCECDFERIINNQEIDGIVIATPSHTHYSLTRKALLAGKHVYVEKPIATNSQEAKELVNLAEAKGLVLMVGHLLLYHPAVNRLKSLIREGILGEIAYVQSDRLNINYYKNDRSVLWDLAPHDLSMVSYILDKKPLEVKSAVGYSVNNDGIIDITHVDLQFEDNIIVHLSDSWIHPLKRVVLLVRGAKATAILDDTFASNKIEIYDDLSSEKKLMDCPPYIEIEPLKLECQHFLSCIKNNLIPRTDGLNGYETVKILEEAEKIMLGGHFNKISNITLASSRRKRQKFSGGEF
jgi:UDP-2-acetamido-3-amino-2,3-dideoxy-glucuronate N-acetyltransferase